MNIKKEDNLEDENSQTEGTDGLSISTLPDKSTESHFSVTNHYTEMTILWFGKNTPSDKRQFLDNHFLIFIGEICYNSLFFIKVIIILVWCWCK